MNTTELYGANYCQCCGKKIPEGNAYCLGCAIFGGQRPREHRKGCDCPVCRTQPYK